MAKKTETNGVKAGPTKAEALRASLEANGWKVDNEVHQSFMRERYGVEMTPMQISQYKSVEKRRSGKRRRRAASPAPAAAGVTKSSPRLDTFLKFVSTMRRWEEKFGSKKMLEIIDALYKKA
jgi:hypothetical protein